MSYESELRPILQAEWERVQERIAELEAERDRLRVLVNAQAEDEGLWFQAVSASEAYLQQELRRLHAAIETPKEVRNES